MDRIVVALLLLASLGIVGVGWFTMSTEVGFSSEANLINETSSEACPFGSSLSVRVFVNPIKGGEIPPVLIVENGNLTSVMLPKAPGKISSIEIISTGRFSDVLWVH